MIGVDHWEQGQRRLAAVVAAWRSGAAAAPVLAALANLDQGMAIDDCLPLARLFACDDMLARQMIDDLVDGALGGLAEFPLGQIPLRHAYRQASHTVLLGRSGGVSLAMTAYDGAVLARQPDSRSASFPPMETWLRIVSGEGTARSVRRSAGTHGPLQQAEISLCPGSVFYHDGRRETLQVRSAQGALVVLRLQRRFPAVDTVREFRLHDGAPLHQAAARVEDSRLELAIAVLAAQGRRDAVPALGRIVAGSAAASLRWSALRAVLGLDTRAGLLLLDALAGNGDEVLGPAARELRHDLIEEWPELEMVAQWRG